MDGRFGCATPMTTPRATPRILPLAKDLWFFRKSNCSDRTVQTTRQAMLDKYLAEILRPIHRGKVSPSAQVTAADVAGSAGKARRLLGVHSVRSPPTTGETIIRAKPYEKDPILVCPGSGSGVLGHWRSQAGKASGDANLRKPREGAVARLTASLAGSCPVNGQAGRNSKVRFVDYPLTIVTTPLR